MANKALKEHLSKFKNFTVEDLIKELSKYDKNLKVNVLIQNSGLVRNEENLISHLGTVNYEINIGYMYLTSKEHPTELSISVSMVNDDKFDIQYKDKIDYEIKYSKDIL